MTKSDSSEKLSDKKGAQKPRADGARVALDLKSAQEVGFLGYEVDPTDDAHYTVQGVVEGKPTPETDPAAHAIAREATGIGAGKFAATDKKGGRS